MKLPGDKIYAQRQNLLYLIVGVLVFEGIVRKLVPALGVVVFFLKDILCLLAVYDIVQRKTGVASISIYHQWKKVAILFFPLFINTLFFDPALGFFGAKQYLLFTVTAVLVPLTFPAHRLNEFKRFVAFVALMLIPTSLVAMLQISLPPSHWLNMSVGGDSLENFSAAGRLRVSSTFSFTGQYSFFLNMVTAFLAVRFFLPYSSKNRFLRQISTLVPLILGVLLLIGAFITGGRTAVLGCGAVILIGFIFSAWRSPQLFFRKGVMIFSILLVALLLTRAVKPEFFEAYDQRSKGYGGVSQSEEVQERVLDSFMGWTVWFWDQDWRSIVLGNGLGVMSNGSDQLSSYAAGVRAGGFWTESDFASSIWEGGLYLVFIWYGFRIAVIVACFRVWRTIKSPTLITACSFMLAYVIIIGLIGTLGIQPPMALWWWLSVGAIFALKGFDDNKNNLKI